MLIKLDENITSDAVALLRALGHDVETVESEGLTGAPDDRNDGGLGGARQPPRVDPLPIKPPRPPQRDRIRPDVFNPP